MPPIPGIEEVGYVTSETLWNLRALPRRLVVLGGGPIGCELAQCFARFGSQVTQVEMLPRILIREDPEISEMVMQRFRAEGVERAGRPQGQAVRDRERREGADLRSTEGARSALPFDALLCAVGRVANTKGYGLEELGIGTAEAAHGRDQRVPADPLPEHLRMRRRRRALPVHPHRLAPGLVRVGQRAVRRAQGDSGRTTR